MSGNKLVASDRYKPQNSSIRRFDSSPIREASSGIGRIIAGDFESDSKFTSASKHIDNSKPTYQETMTDFGKHSTVQTSSTNVKAAAEDLKRLYDLQLNLLSSPNLTSLTQNVLTGKLRTSTNLEDLSKEKDELTSEVHRLRKRINELEFNITLKEKSATEEKEHLERLMEELEKSSLIKQKLEEAELEIQTLISERDFHQQSHIELRKLLTSKSATEFALSQLKRELFYKNEEIEQLKRRNVDLEDNISELMLFAQKPRSTSSQNTENFFARKIVELEGQLRKVKEAKFNSENFGAQKETIPNSEEFLKDNILLKSQIDLGKKDQAELNSLREENQRLKTALKSSENEQVEELKNKLILITKEKTQLQHKVDELALQLSQKQRELLQHINSSRVESVGQAQLIEKNQKLTLEVNKLQEKLRSIETLNRTSNIVSADSRK